MCKRLSMLFLCCAFSVLFLTGTTVEVLAKDKAKDKESSPPIMLARVKLSGSLADALPQQNPFGPSPAYFKSQLDLIRKAAKDDEIAGIDLRVDSPLIGTSKVSELVGVLREFKESGKKIFGFAEEMGMKDLMIYSCCDYLAIPESGVVIMPGLNAEIMYYKKFFELLGIEYIVEHIGDYKSAYENYHLDGMSEENRLVLENLLDTIYFTIVSTIADNRGIETLKVIQAIDEGILCPRKALAYGLVDEVCYHDQYEEHVKKMLKAEEIEVEEKYGRKDKDLDLDNPLVLFSQLMSAFQEGKKKESKKPKIALIYASGQIYSGKNKVDPFSGEVTIGSDTLVEAIESAAEDETVKAIVLRINSPGGSGLASDMIWRAEKLAKAKKPFIVSMADVAGSGGYYIAHLADVIVAQPSTLTGSIGVVSAIPNASKTMDKLGIKIERLQRGKNAGLFSVFTPVEEVNIHALTSYMESFYWDFVDKVAAGRGMTREAVHKVAQGRVWTGKQALENGLVDALGGLDDALRIARLKAGFTDETDWELKEMPKAPDFFESLSESFGVRMALHQVVKALGLKPMEAMLLEMPEIRTRIGRLASMLELCRNENRLLVMPMDIQVNF